MNTLNLKVPISIFKEAGSFVVFCPVLDVTGVGRTQKQAQRRFQEAVEIFFEETLKRGTTEEVLIDLGWQRVKKIWEPPLEVSHKLGAIQIPVAA